MMKKFSAFKLKAVSAALFCVLFFASCNQSGNKGGDPDAPVVGKDTSYAFGMFAAMMMTQQGVHLHYDYQAFMEGFRDFSEHAETRLTLQQAGELIDAQLSSAQEQETPEEFLRQAESNLAEGAAFLAENSLKNGISTTASGLQFEVIAEGGGERPEPGDVVLVHYEGSFINGEVFDSSYSRGIPAQFPLGGVIPGFSEGILLMSEGSTYRLFLPSELAYGLNSPGSIPPNSMLIFQIELLEIVRD